MKGGVTTVYASADSSDVIGARGTLLKTAGPLEERVFRRADAVKAVMGGDPSGRGEANLLPPYYGPPPTVLTRRPTTRMGVDWVFRKAFYDAQRSSAGLELHGADMPPRARPSPFCSRFSRARFRCASRPACSTTSSPHCGSPVSSS